MRKDWKEAYYEEDFKPFKSRWPDGHAAWAEDRNPFGDNVAYPAGFDPEKWTPETETLFYAGLSTPQDLLDHELKTDRIVVNLGPQHPSTHGVFRMVVSLEGETIIDLKPVMGLSLIHISEPTRLGMISYAVFC